MSTLIKELEARKDDYILVADVINPMAKATNSTPNEVVKYLMGFDIDEHLTIFYMDEYYCFEPYCSWLEQVGNDANITYFKKADVMAFEPITKHVVFDDSPASKLGEYQKLLITYELFTPEKIACLLTDSNPAYNHNNDDYNARLDMVSNAIDASKLNYVNDKDEILAEQIKIWLKNNKIIFEGFNDDLSLEQSIQVSQLQKRIDELESQLSKFQTAAPDVVSIPFGKRIDLINKDLPQDERLKESYQIYSNNFSFHEDMHPVNTPDEMIKRIQGLLKVIKRKDSKILELEKQTNAPAHTQAEIDELKEQLNKANAELVTAKTATTAQPFDWQNMSEHIYPPELHLAIMIWQRIYVDNELKEKHIPSHNGKASAIARKIGLNPKSTLFNRVAMIINTAKSKNEQASLAEPLRAIEQLYMPPRKEKTTS